MKKITIVLLFPILIAGLITGCGQPVDLGTGAQQASTEAVSTIDISNPTDDVLFYNDTPISILYDIDLLKATLGEPDRIEGGMGHGYYVYGSSSDQLAIDTIYYSEQKMTHVSRIMAFDHFRTSRGIGPGSSKDDIIAAYGEPSDTCEYTDQTDDSSDEALYYEFEENEFEIYFSLKKGTVVDCTYMNKSPMPNDE